MYDSSAGYGAAGYGAGTGGYPAGGGGGYGPGAYASGPGGYGQAPGTGPYAYPPGAYGPGGYPPAGSPGLEPEFDEGPRGPGLWGWAAGLLGLVILVLAGAAIFLVLSRGSAGPTPAPVKVAVPNFIGQTIGDAQRAGSTLGLEVQIGATEQSSEKPEGTIIAQDPVAGTMVDSKSIVTVTVVSGKPLVSVPDLRGLTEDEARQTLLDANLKPGTMTEEFDASAPEGQVIGQSPGPSVEVAVGTPVDYVLSKGPEETPTPSPSESPSETPSATPEPTPPPTDTPPPTPPPTDTPVPTLAP
jgi:serine/threonine-protein kinase